MMRFFKKYLAKAVLAALLLCCNSLLYAQGNGNAGTEPKPDILDSLLAILIILFILSMIVEKITQLIRKYAPFIKPNSKVKKVAIGKQASTVWRHINKKQTGVFTELDKKIEREVNSLSFVLSVAIALIFRVDLFKMFREPDPRTVLFWSDQADYEGYEKVAFAFSILLTGFFLTFGSKFFHDLIDTLLQVKNLKRKLVDDNTYNVETIQQFDRYIEKKYSDIIEAAILQNAELLSDPLMIGPPLHGKMSKKGKIIDCITVHLIGTDRGKIPQAVNLKIADGHTVSVPVNVIHNVDVPVAHARQGDAVASIQNLNFKGTICCKVQRTGSNEPHLVTCSHVMTQGTADNNFGDLATPVNADVNGVAGNFVWALRTDKLDLALIQQATNNFQYVISPQKERALEPADMLTTTVKVVRQNGNIIQGKVINYCAPRGIPIQYTNGVQNIFNLILLADVIDLDNNVFASLTVPGDSGACVYDDKNRPVGMIIAGNSQFSYAIAMTDILTKLNATITT
jgi:hypothetical protein